MSEVPTSTNDLDSVLWGAESAVTGADNHRAWDLARVVLDDAAASTEQRWRAELVMARAALGMGFADDAEKRLNTAESLGAPAEQIGPIRGDIRRMAGGLTAAGGTVEGADETSAVIAAAREAIAAGQYAQAERLLHTIWETTRSDQSQLSEASYQMGRALLGQHRLEQAKEYADWAASQSHPDAAELQKSIAAMAAGDTSLGDGVQVKEQLPLFALAQEAYVRHDYSGALDLYVGIYESPTSEPKLRAACSFNIAQCHRFLGNSEMAKAWYAEHLRISPDSPYAKEIESNIDRLDELAHLTESLGI